MKPINYGPGVAPAVSVVDGLVYTAFGVVGGCRLIVATPDGVEVRRADLPGGFDQSFPRFDGPWLAYRQDGVHGWAAVALNVLTGKSWTFNAAGGTYGLTISEPFGVLAYENQQPGQPWRIWFGNIVNGLTAETPLPGAPDGLDQILAVDRVSLRKDTREDVPHMLYPVRSADLTVGERRDNDGPFGGIAVLLTREPLRVALVGQNVPDPRCASDGSTYAIVCWGPAGVQLLLGTRADLLALPTLASLTAPSPAPVTPPPTPTPPVEPMPMTGLTREQFATLENVRRKYAPAADIASGRAKQLTPEDMGAILNETAWIHRNDPVQQLGLQAKPGGTAAIQPRTNKGIWNGIWIKRGGENFGQDVLGAASIGQAIPVLGDVTTTDPRAFTFVAPVEPLDGQAEPVPAPAPAPNVGELAQLRAENAKLKADLAAAAATRAALEQQVANLQAEAQKTVVPNYDVMMQLVRDLNAAFRAAQRKKERDRRDLDPAAVAHLVRRFLIEGYDASELIADAKQRGAGA